MIEVRYIIERWRKARQTWRRRGHGRSLPSVQITIPEGWVMERVTCGGPAGRAEFLAAWAEPERSGPLRPRRARCVLIDDGGRELRSRTVRS